MKQLGRNAHLDLLEPIILSPRDQAIKDRAQELVTVWGWAVGDARQAAQYERACEEAPRPLYADDDVDWA